MGTSFTDGRSDRWDSQYPGQKGPAQDAHEDRPQDGTEAVEKVKKKRASAGEWCLAVCRLLDCGHPPDRIAQMAGVSPAYVVEAAKVGRWLEEVMSIHGREAAAPLLGKEVKITTLLSLMRSVHPEEALQAFRGEKAVRRDVGVRPHRIRLSRLNSMLDELVAKVQALMAYRARPRGEALGPLVEKAQRLLELLREMEKSNFRSIPPKLDP